MFIVEWSYSNVPLSVACLNLKFSVYRFCHDNLSSAKPGLIFHTFVLI